MQFGKRIALEKDSLLGQAISIEEINLSQLMGGEIFTVPCYLAFNKYYIDKISALPNSRANSFAFLNTCCAINIAKFCNIQP